MKATETILCVKVNKAAMRNSERVFKKLGLTTDAAFNMFLTHVSRKKELPLRLSLSDERDEDLLVSDEVRREVLGMIYEDEAR